MSSVARPQAAVNDANVRSFPARQREGHTYAHARRIMQDVIYDDPLVETAAEMAVMQALTRRMSPDGTSLRPSVETLARDARLSEQTVSRTLKRLRAKALIEYEPGTQVTEAGVPKGGRLTTRYRFGTRLRACLNVGRTDHPDRSGPSQRQGRGITMTPLPCHHDPRSEDLIRDPDQRSGIRSAAPSAPGHERPRSIQPQQGSRRSRSSSRSTIRSEGDEAVITAYRVERAKHLREEQPYVVTWKDEQGLCDLRDLDAKDLAKRLTAFFEDESQHYERCGFALWVFADNVNAFIENKPRSSRMMDLEETERYLRDGRR